MPWKRIAKSLLFPPPVLIVALLPAATVLLVLFLGEESPLAYISYGIAFYTLTVACVRIPQLLAFFKSLKRENKYVQKWLDDPRLRVNVSLYGSLVWNIAYALLQLWLGLYYGTFWFYSLGAYYICLALMRFFLLHYTQKYTAGEHRRSELVRYRACGWILLAMNLSLSLILFFMVYWDRTFHHHQITAIALALYTFTALTVAVVSIVKYRRYQSPVFSAAKVISLVAALVSVLTLEATMLTAFGTTMAASERKWMLGTTGAAVSAAIVSMAVYMIVQGTRNLRKEVENGR